MCVSVIIQILYDDTVSHVTCFCFRIEIWFDDVDEILLEDGKKSKDPLLLENPVTQ